MPHPDPFRNLLALRHKVAAHARRVARRHPGALTCHRGCDACCATERMVGDMEFDRLARAVAALPAETRRRLREGRGAGCSLLLDGACAVYAERPLVCRAHGLPTGHGPIRDVCPRNFRERDLAHLPDEDILSLERVTALLVVTNALYCQETGQAADRRRPVGALLEG